MFSIIFHRISVLAPLYGLSGSIDIYTMLNNTTFSPTQSFLATSGDDSKTAHVYFSTSIVIAVLSPVAVVANTLILAAIWKKNFSRTPFHILLSGLALTDLCTGLISQPLYAATFLMYSINSTVVHKAPMQLVKTIRTIGESGAVIFITMTILTIAVMSIERWLYMSRRSQITLRRGCFTVIVLLLFPISTVVFRILENVDEAYGRTMRLIFITQMLFCYLITCFAHFKVYQIIRRHQQQVQANTTSQSFGESAIDLAKYKKSIATMIYILLLFSFCFLPYIVSSMMYFGLSRKTLETYSTFRVSVVFLFLSSSLNPALYLWRMRDIRNGVKHLFDCLIF